MSDTWYREPSELPPYVDWAGRRWLLDGTCLDEPPRDTRTLREICDEMLATIVVAEPAPTVPTDGQLTIEKIRALFDKLSTPSRYLPDPVALPTGAYFRYGGWLLADEAEQITRQAADDLDAD